MKISSNLGYREIEKLGDILKELGNKGGIDGRNFEISDLEINYNPSYDSFEISDGNIYYNLELSEI